MNTEPRPRVVDCVQRGALHVDRLADVRLPGADLASREHGFLILRVALQRLLGLAVLLPVLTGGEQADGVGRRAPDHGREDGNVLGAVLAGEVTRRLELLLHLVPLDARVWVDRYVRDDGHGGASLMRGGCLATREAKTRMLLHG